jgi:hypothetical protein
VIEGKRYIVISHYTGEKDLDDILRHRAINMAYRDMGV